MTLELVQVTPVPAESVTVEQYLRAECHRYETRVTVSSARNQYRTLVSVR